MSIPDLKAGEPCRECPQGRLYPRRPGPWCGSWAWAPLAAKIHELEKLRCNLCGQVFKNPGNWRPWKYQTGIPVNDS